MAVFYLWWAGLPSASADDHCGKDEKGKVCGENATCRLGCELVCNKDYCDSKGPPGKVKCLCNEGFERNGAECVCPNECPRVKHLKRSPILKAKRESGQPKTSEWKDIDGRNYSVIPVKKSWEEAASACNAKGAFLGSVSSSAVSKEIARSFALQSYGGGWLAIGLNKLGSDKWTWLADGSDVGWNNWIAGVPGTDVCGLATLKQDGTFMKWLDLRCDGDFGPMWALCEQ
ncbi:hypothetical protein AAVH_33890 [Aphelenchoides avenae]|nr:hypothetical protein AAVH_33890 [Aphelenchus avenae]